MPTKLLWPLPPRQGLFHPARKVREVYWRLYNNVYIGSQVCPGWDWVADCTQVADCTATRGGG